MRNIISALLLAAAIPALVATTAPAARTDGRVTGFREVAVKGSEGTRYVVRIRYAAPGSWRRVGARRGLSHRFGPIGSCRIRVTISANAIADASEAAVDRATRLLPGRGRNVLDYGTRTNAAYRVVRGPGKEVNALLVKPAPTVREQPVGRIVWIELHARAVIDRRTECHSGGPRTVGAQLGDAFAAARLGGFQAAARAGSRSARKSRTIEARRSG